MLKLFQGALLLTFILFFSCTNGKDNGDKRPIVLIKTEFGDMKVALYNETPKHRDNFLKLAKARYFDGLLFHRVIHNFMIQGGDPDTRNAQPGQKLGNGGPGYELDPEFNPKLIHKKGVLAAAREGDQINPGKKSSGSQFYIVQGVIFRPDSLEAFETEKNKQLAQDLMNQLAKTKIDSLKFYQRTANRKAFEKLVAKLQAQAVEKASQSPFKLTEEQKQVYTTIGGTPHLDGNYTVFGEVIDGLDVLDAIAAQPTGPNDRPVKDITMVVKVIRE